MLLRDQMEPLARYIPWLLLQNGCDLGRGWWYYVRDGDRPGALGNHHDLTPQRQTRDDQVGYFWAKNGGAHIWLNNIRFLPVDPKQCDMRSRIILESKLGATDALPFRNPTSETQGVDIEYYAEQGVNEVNAILAGFEKKVTVSAEVSGGVKGIGEAKASVVDETTIRASYENTTGRSYQSGTRKIFRLTQPAYTAGEGRLTWSEQTCQTRVRSDQIIDCEVEIYWWRAYKKYDARRAKRTTRHRKSHRVVFPSLHLLVALLEGRGSVHTPFFEHFAEREVGKRYVDLLEKLRKQKVDFLTEPYAQSSEFKTEITDLVNLPRPDDTNDKEDAS